MRWVLETFEVTVLSGNDERPVRVKKPDRIKITKRPCRRCGRFTTTRIRTGRPPLCMYCRERVWRRMNDDERENRIYFGPDKR